MKKRPGLAPFKKEKEKTKIKNIDQVIDDILNSFPGSFHKIPPPLLLSKRFLLSWKSSNLKDWLFTLENINRSLVAEADTISTFD